MAARACCVRVPVMGVFRQNHAQQSRRQKCSGPFRPAAASLTQTEVFARAWISGAWILLKEEDEPS